MSINSCFRQEFLRLHLNEPWNVGPDPLSIYPEAGELRLAIAGWLGVPPACVLPTAGADHGLEIAVRAIGGPVITLDPDFPRYQEHAQNCNQEIIKIAVPVDGEGFPTDEIEAAANSAKLLIVGTIGNPTGYVVPDTFLAVLRERHAGIVVCVDDCYAPFNGVAHHDWAAAVPNVIAVGSMSKRGFPGLRVGYLVARPEMIERLRRFVSPFAVSGLSLQVTLGLLRDPAFPAREKSCVERQRTARDHLVREFLARDIAIARPVGNWVLAKFGPGAPKLAEELERSRILVQAPPHPALAEWLRISTPNLEAVVRLLKVLDGSLAGAVVAENGLLRLRDDYRNPDRWLAAPFVFRVAGKVFAIDHVAVTMPDRDQHCAFMQGLQKHGAEVVEGPGVWPDDFCADPATIQPDLSMVFATAKLPGGLLVIAAPNKPGDQLDRWRKDRGGDAVHHIGIRADGIHCIARDLAAEGWRPITATPVADGTLTQWFLKNKACQIIELIARPVGGDATFTCNNIAALRNAEVRNS